MIGLFRKLMAFQVAVRPVPCVAVKVTKRESWTKSYDVNMASTLAVGDKNIHVWDKGSSSFPATVSLTELERHT